MAIKIKSVEEIEIIRKNCVLLSKTMGEIATQIHAGTTGLQLDKISDEYITDLGAHPSFKGYNRYPNALCISVNDEVVHGIPTNVAYKSGDIVSVDCGLYMHGYHADMAYTFGIGEVKTATQDLLRVTKQSLLLGIDQAIAGKRTGDIGFAIQDYCEHQHPYKCVRELVGHGLGKSLHEDPQVPNYGRRNDGAKLPENCTIAIEPMVNLGKRDVYTKRDNWTIATLDGTPSAHYEHTILVKVGKAEILSSFEWIEMSISKNQELVKI
ncbi:MAG: type I methionyl aminopeptidase [Bacteroidetes bacterium]|nr:type I methionyl aminopeptidase [Bacteroidota bacterium]